MNHHLGVSPPNALEIHGPLDSLEPRRNLCGELLEGLHVGAEELDLHGLGIGFHVADHVLQDLGKFNFKARYASEDLVPEVVHDVVDIVGALGAGFEFGDDFAHVLSGGKRAHLRSRPAQSGSDVLLVREDDRLRLLVQPIGLRERRSGWRKRIEHEAAFVHLGEEALLHPGVEKIGEAERSERRDQDHGPKTKRPADKFFVGAINGRDEVR